MEKILVVLPVEERHKELFRQVAPEEEILFLDGKELTREMVQDANVIIGNVPPNFLEGSPSLRWIQLNSAGTDGYLNGVLPKGAILTNATGAYGLAISEHMLAGLLTLMKKMPAYLENQKKHQWIDHGPVTSIYGTKTLVVGLGDIGNEFAKRMWALGSTVIGIRRSIGEVPEYVEAVYGMDQLAECVAEADIVASCLPGSPETLHIFDATLFSKMKQGAYFLNVGRGNAVVSEELANALVEGRLAGAMVDVTEPEPLPENHPLWDAKNILITPHVSGGYHLQETHERIVGIAIDNLKSYLHGEKLTRGKLFIG